MIILSPKTTRAKHTEIDDCVRTLRTPIRSQTVRALSLTRRLPSPPPFGRVGRGNNHYRGAFSHLAATHQFLYALCTKNKPTNLHLRIMALAPRFFCRHLFCSFYSSTLFVVIMRLVRDRITGTIFSLSLQLNCSHHTH